MVVRRVGPGEIAALLPLVAQYWEFEAIPDVAPTVVQAQLERLVSSPTLGAAWVATNAQGPVGYLVVVYVFSLEHRGLTAEIDEFFIIPEFRACGLGSKLLADAEAESVRRGCTNISLQVASSNRGAHCFYRRHGYSERSAFLLLEKDLGAV